MPLLSSLFKKEDKSCLGFFVGCKDHLHVTLIDAETEEFVVDEKFDGKSLKSFIKNIPTTFGTKLKAVFIEVFEYYGHSYKRNIDLCHALREKLNFINVPHSFVTHLSSLFSSMIIGANINLYFGDTIVCGKVNLTSILFVEMQFTESGFEEINYDSIEIDGVPTQKEIDTIRDKIKDYCQKHKFFILEKCAENPWIMPLKKMFKKANVIFADPNIPKYLVESTKWLMDKTYTKFYVIPKCVNEYAIFNAAALTFLSIDENDFLPCSKTIVASRNFTSVWQCELFSEKPNNVIHKMLQNCHRNKITFSVDAEGFTKFRVEPIMLPQIQFWPFYLNDTVKLKIPMIGFCDNFSVICIYNADENRYKFLDGWNGIYGNELIINFSNKTPLFCEQALSASNPIISYDFEQNGQITKFQDPKKPIYGMSKRKPYPISDEIGEQYVPGTLVYGMFGFKVKLNLGLTASNSDLIPIMSMDVNDIKIDNSWGFRIVKDESNPVILEFMNHENLLKRATPAFLMALLLKEHLKALKNEVGEKPEKIGFCILNEGYGNEEKERIKNGLEEACDLIKIEHVFIGF